MPRIQIDFPDEAVVFRYDITVRIGDVNYFEHLGHDALLRLLHEARARFFLHHGHHESDTEGCACVVADLAVRYLAEARFGQMLRIEIARGETSSHGAELYYRVSDRDKGRLIALAKTGHVFFTGKEARLQKVPDAFHTMLHPQGAVPNGAE